MSDPEMPLGARVRARRTELELTQAALAERAGLTIKTVQRIERGQARVHRATLEVLARALNLTPSDLEEAG